MTVRSLLRRTARVAEDDGAGVLIGTADQRAFQEQSLRTWVVRQPSRSAIRQRPKGRHNDDLGSSSDELAKGFREGQVPADEQPALAKRCVEGLVRLVGATRRQVRPLGVPEILLLVSRKDLAIVGDEVGDVKEVGVLP